MSNSIVRASIGFSIYSWACLALFATAMFVAVVVGTSGAPAQRPYALFYLAGVFGTYEMNRIATKRRTIYRSTTKGISQ